MGFIPQCDHSSVCLAGGEGEADVEGDATALCPVEFQVLMLCSSL